MTVTHYNTLILSINACNSVAQPVWGGGVAIFRQSVISKVSETNHSEINKSSLQNKLS